jgi:hypothetical protein
MVDKIMRNGGRDCDILIRDRENESGICSLEPLQSRSKFVYVQHYGGVHKPKHANQRQGRDTRHVDQLGLPLSEQCGLLHGSDPGATSGERLNDVLRCQSPRERPCETSMPQHD